MKEFARILKELRIEKKLSIQELARQTKLSSSSISRWENNQSEIKLSELIILSKFFNVTIDFLTGLEK